MASESEHEKRETLADVVALMRRGTKLPGYWRSCDLNKILAYHADRIEAAWKRERAEVEANALAVGGIVEAARHKPGNAAAMREALVAIQKLVQANIASDEFDDLEPLKEYVQIRDICNAALSAPARNCDIYATATEAIKAQDVAFNEDNFKNGECRLGCPGCDDGLIDCKILWLFAPAERKGEGDGR